MTYRPTPLVDSGAYSAWRRNKPIELSLYCDYLNDHRDCLTTYVALDVIRPGDPESAATEGYANYRYMRGQGLDPIPVLHQGEDITWLYKYLDDGATYVGLSATSLRGKSGADPWYAQVWRHLVNRDGQPIARVHCFGDTREATLCAFPWASADSTSWFTAAQRFGIFQVANTKIAHRADERHTNSIRDRDSLSAADEQALTRYLTELGLRPDVFDRRPVMGRRTESEQWDFYRNYAARSFLQLKAVQDLESRVRRHRVTTYHPTRELAPTAIPPERPVVSGFQFSIYPVVGKADLHLPMMALIGHPTMLQSYFALSELDLTVAFTRDPGIVHRDPRWATQRTVLESLFFTPVEAG